MSALLEQICKHCTAKLPVKGRSAVKTLMASVMSMLLKNQLYVVLGLLLTISLCSVITVMLWTLNGNKIIIQSTGFDYKKTYTDRRGGNSNNYYEPIVIWKLYGEDLMLEEDIERVHQTSNRNGPSFLQGGPQHTGSRLLLENIPKDFQEQLHIGTPLSCQTGAQGLISKKYKRFLRTLVDYTSFHKNTRTMMGRARTLVWQCTKEDYCGGLVDRLKGITYTLLLAMFSRRRLILDWRGPERTFLHPNMIDWTDEDAEDEMLPWTDEDAEDEMIPRLRMFSFLGDYGIDVSKSDLQYNLETVEGMTNTVILSTNLEPCTLQNATKTAHQKWIKDGLQRHGLAVLSSEDLDNIVGIIFRYLFLIKQRLLTELDLARNALGLRGYPYTGVQIRTGFVGSERPEGNKHPKLIHEEADWDKMLRCAIKTADRLLGDESLLFLASDSVLVKHMALSRYGGRFRSLGNRLIHLDKMTKLPNSNQNSTEGVVTSWIDFLLLAEAYSHVRGSSGFPWAAGLLCSIPSERLIDGIQCVPENTALHL